jgi:SAM-dependent methyltransferase
MMNATSIARYATIAIVLSALPACRKKDAAYTTQNIPTTNKTVETYVDYTQPPQKMASFGRTRLMHEQNTQQLMDELYQGISGFRAPKEDEQMVTQAGGAPTYGEITYDGLQHIIDDIKPQLKDGVFYDLGSGVGKVVVHVYLNSDVKKAAGIELCTQRFDNAMNVRNTMEQRGLIADNKKIEFIDQDILKANINDATVVYMCSTCFDQNLMTNIMKKLAQEAKPGLLLLTLKKLPENYREYGFEMIEPSYQEKMTWSESSPVHRYKLVRVVS